MDAGGGAAGADDDSQQEQQDSVHLTLSQLPALVGLLQAIKIAAKQICTVVIAPEGLLLRWEDDSKTLQSSVQLRREVFSGYDVGDATSTAAGGKCVFGVGLLQLVDTLSVFAASAAKADLHLHYPGPDGELQLEMVDEGDGLSLSAGGRCVMYARIATLEQDPPGDMLDYWTAPVSYFLVTPGALLKEAVEDLEWPGSAVAVRLTRDPVTIVLSASGTGSLEVQLSANDLAGCQVGAAEVLQHYRYKNMRAALANIPVGRELGGSVSTKVQIDAHGLLKVTHIVPLGGGGGGGRGIGRGGGGTHPVFASTPSLSGFGQSQQQMALEEGHQAVIQFVSVPVDDEDEGA